VDVALCARALSVAYRVLAIDDPLQANPRGVKLWEWESRALGLEHFAEFVQVEIARAEGRTTNFVSAKSYYNAAVLGMMKFYRKKFFLLQYFQQKLKFVLKCHF
jgi:hypothetical protein